VNETRWSLLGVRIEILRDLISWLAVATFGVGIICAYASVQDLRRAYQGQAFHAEWYRYLAAAVSGAGIPLIIVGMFVSLAILLTAGVRVADAFGEAASDDESADDDGEDSGADGDDGGVVEVEGAE
jgi:hypothetical protein